MNISLRKYPYPFKAMLAICSDLDETPGAEVYFEICRYLNTDEMTSIGRGVDLEVGNSIYFDMPEGQFSYWNADDSGRDKIHKLIRSGYIDCLHSFGDYSLDRESILKNWGELISNECVPKVWIDHAQAATNLDPDIMCGYGAVYGSEAYHADITFGDNGIEYVWKGRVTSLVAQNVRRSYRGLMNYRHPLASMKTIATEFAKGVLGRMGYAKYVMHADNRLMRRVTLSDGTETWEFMRCNPNWAGVSCFEKGKEIGKVLTEKMLNVLVEKEGCSIMYTHQGKVHDINKPFGDDGKESLNRLAKRYRDGEIMVLTTKRVLDYIKTRDSVVYSTETVAGRDVIRIDASRLCAGAMLGGLTWYVPKPERVDVYLDNKIVDCVVTNPKDSRGLNSITIPLKPLDFPSL